MAHELAAGALVGVRVIDLSADVAGAFCCKYLAGMGADVVKVEPPSGDATRRLPPFVDESRGHDSSALFLYLNAGKRGVIADLGDPDGRRIVRELIAASDVVVEDLPPGRMAELGLGYEELAAEHATLVMTSLTPFGQDGPYADFPAEPITISAWGGLLNTTGRPEREPLLQGGHQTEYQAGAVAAAATVAAIYGAEAHGRGEHVDCSAMEAVSIMLDANMFWNIIDPNPLGPWVGMRRRLGNQAAGAPRGVWPCKDGWSVVIPRLDRGVESLAELTGDERFADPRFQTPAGRSEHADEIAAILLPWLMDRTREDIYHRAQALGHYFGYVCTVDELKDLPQLKAREFFVHEEHPLAGELVYPGAPAVLTETPWRIGRAPGLGEHTGEVLAEAASAATDRRSGRSSDGEATDAALPLDGIRVLDFTRAWAGPLATKFLSDLGADVVKVHSLHGGERLGRIWNPTTGGYSRMLDSGKRAVGIDATRPKGQEVLKRLVRSVDMVVENFSPRVMPRFGLDYHSLKAIKPDLVMLSLSGMGATGPESDYLALGETVEGMSGLVSQQGYHDEDAPMKTGVNYGDPIAAVTAAALGVAALRHRRRTGRGQWIDLSLLETAAQFLGEAIVAWSASGQLPERIGNTHPEMAPHGVYPAAGDDRWVTLAVRTDDEWERLTSVLDRPDLRDDPRFAKMSSRLRHGDELNAAMAECTALRDGRDLALALVAVGVPAAPVQSPADLMDDEHHRARAFWGTAVAADSSVGEYPLNRAPLVLGDIRQQVRSPASFSEHQREVLREWGGYTDSEIDALNAEQVIAEAPISQEGGLPI